MRTLYFLVLVLGLVPCLFAQALAEPAEIVIEMQGTPDLPQTSFLWSQSARQLARRLKGKTREQVLYAVPVVSDKDRIVRSEKKEYALVEYYEGGEFRKFLFNAEAPQLLLAVAATPEEVLAVNKTYGINIGLSRRAFEKFYSPKIQREKADFLPEDVVLYKLTPALSQKEHWFLFEKQNLKIVFETEEEKENYLKHQQPAHPVSLPARPVKPKTYGPRKSYKALVSGGTVQDQMYMPHVVSPDFVPRSHLTPVPQD